MEGDSKSLMKLVLAHDGASVSLLAVARRVLNRQSPRTSLYQLGRALGEPVESLREALAPLGSDKLNAIAYRGRYQHQIVASEELLGVWRGILIPAAEAPYGLRACFSALDHLSLASLRADELFSRMLPSDTHTPKAEVVGALLASVLSTRETFADYQVRRLESLDAGARALLHDVREGPVRISTLMAKKASSLERWNTLRRLSCWLLIRLRCVENDSKLTLVAESYSPDKHVRGLIRSQETNTDSLADCLKPAVDATLRALEGKWVPSAKWFQSNFAERRLSDDRKALDRKVYLELPSRRRKEAILRDLQRFFSSWRDCLGRTWLDLAQARSLELALYEVSGKWWPVTHPTPSSDLVDLGLALGLLSESSGRVALTSFGELWLSGKLEPLPGASLSWARNTDRLTLILDRSWRTVTDQLIRRVGFVPGTRGAVLERKTLECASVRLDHLLQTLSGFCRLSQRQITRLESWSEQSRSLAIEKAQLLHKSHPLAPVIHSGLACPWPIQRTHDYLVFVGATSGRFRTWLNKLQPSTKDDDGGAQ